MEKVIVVQILKHFLVCSLTSEPSSPSLSPSLSHHFFDHPLTLRSRFLCSSHKCFSVTLGSLVCFPFLSSLTFVFLHLLISSHHPKFFFGGANNIWFLNTICEFYSSCFPQRFASRRSYGNNPYTNNLAFQTST